MKMKLSNAIYFGCILYFNSKFELLLERRLYVTSKSTAHTHKCQAMRAHVFAINSVYVYHVMAEGTKKLTFASGRLDAQMLACECVYFTS